MKKALWAGGAAAGLALGGLVGPASAATETQTIRFNSVSQGPAWELEMGNSFTSVEKLWRSGKQVGFGLLNCDYLAAVSTLDCSYVASVAGGTISVELDRFAVNNNGHYTGKVVGGTGKYKGVHGTAVAHEVTKSGNVVRIVLTFHK